eukprot:TRINITY_DN2603_c0_g1_i7.p1 TRINITY_DN2603_c0_g1~~TRINITY_DN2603_c0_g1_i7.p1  ORF type:complete len:495 (+),score=59.85 TRINITY_DN2603_c0_g1_i7:172-1656(+)
MCIRDRCNRCRTGDQNTCFSCINKTTLNQGVCQFNITKANDSLVTLNLNNMKINSNNLKYILATQIPSLYSDLTQIKQMVMNLPKNQIDSFLEFNNLRSYPNLQQLQIYLDSQNPPLQGQDQLNFFDIVNQLQQFEITLVDNSIDNLNILKNLVNENSIQKLRIDMTSNSLRSIGDLQFLFLITTISNLEIDFQDNNWINNLDLLEQLSSLSALKQITLNLINLNANSHNFVANLNVMSSLNQVTIMNNYNMQDNPFICSMVGNYIQANSNLQLSCNLCSPFCDKCTSSNNCLTCISSPDIQQLPVQGYCQITPPTQPDEGVYDFRSIYDRFGDIEFQAFITQVSQYFNNFKTFDLNLQYTKVTSVDSLSTLFNNSQLNLLELQIDKKITNYNLCKMINYLNVNGLLEADINDIICLMDSNYISYDTSSRSLSCSPCAINCRRCFGSQSNACLACNQGCTLQVDQTCKCSSKLEEQQPSQDSIASKLKKIILQK